MKTKPTATTLALGALFPLVFCTGASAQSAADLLKEIQALKARIEQLEAQAKKVESQGPPVDRDEFNRIKTKAEALEDQKEAAGFKGFRVTGGLDVTYLSNRDKHTNSFAFLGNFPGGTSNEVYSYDNSYQGIAYIDFQKELEEGSKWRLTLAPHKSAGSQYNFGSIVHEASASIPLTDLQTRFVVGQIPDISGYEPFLANFAGTNGVSSGLLFPGYANFFITKNLLFDFTAATFYTGVGLDITRGPWSSKVYLANFNAARYDINNSQAGTRLPTLIFNAAYAKSEFWGAQVTGYYGRAPTPVDRPGLLQNIETDWYFTKGDFNTNFQVTFGTQKRGAFNTELLDDGVTQQAKDSRWLGFSWLVSQRVTPPLTLAARLDYLGNSRNGGGTFNLGTLPVPALDDAGVVYAGDFYSGFGPGDPNDPGYDPNKGANRTALALSGTYRLSQAVALRAEIRFDRSSLPTFYDFSTGAFRKNNTLLGVQTLVNF